MKINIIKAWKDEEYRASLTGKQLSQVANPVGNVELSDEDMANVNGGTSFTIGTSGTYNSGVGFNSIECCQRMF